MKSDNFSVNLQMPLGLKAEHRRHLKLGKWGMELLIMIIVGTQIGGPNPLDPPRIPARIYVSIKIRDNAQLSDE